MTVRIVLKGCDDETEFSIDIMEKELALLQLISEISKKTSTYQCMPIFEVLKEGELSEKEKLYKEIYGDEETK